MHASTTVPPTDLVVDQMTAIAFASTNDVGEICLQKYWYGKGVRDRAALAPPPTPVRRWQARHARRRRSRQGVAGCLHQPRGYGGGLPIAHVLRGPCGPECALARGQRSRAGADLAVIAIYNSATNSETATYGDLKERADIDCKYMNETELKYARPAIYSVTTARQYPAASAAMPSTEKEGLGRE